MIQIAFTDAGVKRTLAIQARSLNELRPVFAKFTKYMRAEVDQVFASQGDGAWPARSEKAEAQQQSTKAARIEAIGRNQYNSLRGRLRSERNKAAARLARTPGSNSKLTASRQRSVERYAAQQWELERVAAGGDKSAQGFARLNARMARRELRAQEKIAAVESGSLLGAIGNSITVDFDKTGWEMRSVIKWAGVHNKGGVVNNGAAIPARTFLEWTPQRIEMFVKMANDYFAARALRASKGP